MPAKRPAEFQAIDCLGAGGTMGIAVVTSSRENERASWVNPAAGTTTLKVYGRQRPVTPTTTFTWSFCGPEWGLTFGRAALIVCGMVLDKERILTTGGSSPTGDGGLLNMY